VFRKKGYGLTDFRVKYHQEKNSFGDFESGKIPLTLLFIMFSAYIILNTSIRSYYDQNFRTRGNGVSKLPI